MDITTTLSGRISAQDAHRLALMAENDSKLYTTLCKLISDTDDHMSYNALWVLMHCPRSVQRRLATMKDQLIDHLLATEHTGKKRLTLTLLEKMTFPAEEIRTDFLDFCLSKINSTEPKAVRSLCLKLAYTQCRHYPELIGELESEIEMMTYGELHPGLTCARKNILKKIAAAKGSPV